MLPSSRAHQPLSFQIKVRTPLPTTRLEDNLLWKNAKVAHINSLRSSIEELEVIVEDNVGKEELKLMGGEEAAGAEDRQYRQRIFSNINEFKRES